MSHFAGPNAMRALRACLALACVVLGVATLPGAVSAGTHPTTWITVTDDATAARDPDALHGPVVRGHDTDEEPHKLLVEPPAPPGGLTAEQGRVDGEVKLSWNAPAPTDDIEHHDYRYHTGGRYSVWITIPASGSSSNHVGYVNGLTGGVAHTFQVRAINTSGDPGLPSATATATPRGVAPTTTGRAGDVVTLELSPSSIGEDSEVSTVTASLDSASATALTVTVSAEAVAPAAPEDFGLSANRTLEIAAGALTSTGTVTITAVDNTVDAPDKDVTVSGTVAGATDVTGPSDVTLTITDDDVPTPTICTEGSAGVNLCDNVDLMSYLAMNDIGGGIGNDIWGWQDPLTGKEYAIVGRSTGTAFVDISDPLRPTYLGNLPAPSWLSQWRDMKVYRDHAFIVTESSRSGMQVFDLTQLRTVTSPPLTFSETAHYTGFSDAHNIAINVDSGFAYAVGTNTCDGGLHMINIQNPANPTSAGCFSDDGYTHDTQCVNYLGPDPDHQGAEICFNSNEDTLTIVDVTDKARPVMLSRTGYRGSRYTHQGWLTEDHAYFVLGDELDEPRFYNTGTRTYLLDVSDLESPTLTGTHVSTATTGVDHNQYVNGKYTYQANYEAGLRILDVTDIANGNLTEVAFFDMLPDTESYRSFDGAWGNYPFFDSGIVIVSVRRHGLFVLRPNLVDRIQPKVGRAVVDRETLTLTYGEALDETSTPAIDAFAVTVEDAGRSVSGVSVSGRAVTLTLASAVTVAEEVRVTYTVPETSPIRDEAQNNAPGLSSREVRNDTPGPPGTPGAPTVTAASATSLMVTWVEPPNAQPPITDYDVQYRIGDAGDFTDWPHTGTALTATIPRLIEGTTYQVQVLARNPVGVSRWSGPASGAPAPPPNNPPEFPNPTEERSVLENSAAGTRVGAVVEATDPDTNDVPTYTLSAGDVGSFTIDVASGQIRVGVGTMLDRESKDTYRVTVTASDPSTATDTAAVTITVEDVNEGFTVSGPDHISREENTTGVVATFTAIDPEGSPLAWSVEGVDYEAMRINARGELSFNVPPDYDQPADMQRANPYHIEVIARDEVNESALPVTIQVTNVDEAPVLSGEAHVTLEENSGVFVGCYGAADPERAEVTWKALSGLDGTKFELIDGTDPCTRELRFKEPPDFDARADSNRDNRYQVTLNTSDKASAGKPGSLAVTVTLTDVDEPPVITGPASVDFDENATGTVATYSALDPEAGTVALRLIGSDSDDFSFTDGVLRFDSPPNFEDPDDAGGNNTYEVTVEARDALDTATQDVTVNVTNVDEAGRLALSSGQPLVGTELTATLTDLDGGLSGQSWTWERSPNRSSGWSTIGGASGRRYTPVDGDLNHYLRVTVTYTDGDGPDKDEQATSMNRVQAAPVVNNPPEFPNPTEERSVLENSAAGTRVGAVVGATDPDTGDVLGYTLSGADADSFTIDVASGQIRVGVGTMLDRESKDTYRVTVTASDPSTATDTAAVTITIEDVNEGFTVSGPDHISREENTTGVVATFTAIDPEGSPLAWSVEGVDYEAMRINARGELSFNVPPDYDQPADMQRANPYHIEVIARDEVNESALPVTIQVTNVDEAPVLSGEAHVTLEENSGVFVGCYGAADPERAEVTWKALSGLDGTKFELIDGTDPCTRELRFKEPPDFDARADSNRDNRYQVTLNTSDKASAGKPGSLAVTVTLTDVDEPPVITGPASVDFDENATGTVATYSALDPEAGTVALRLIGSDSDDFSFTDGVLRFDSPPNFEDPDDAGGNNTYEVIVEARDALDTATQDVTVNVTNVDEAGGLTLSSQQPQVGTELTATLTDLDGGLSGQSWTWERSPNRSSGWSTIGGASGRRYTPVDGDLDHYLRVTVDYTDGHGSGKDEQATSMNRVQAAPVVNNPPEFPNPTEERSVLENSAAGTRVGEAVQATDPDTGDVLGYTLSGADADSFTIDVASGQIRVGVGTMLDRESKDTYRVTVTASDPSTATDTAAVTITIEDVNEPPVAVNDTAETDEDPDTATLINVLDNDADPENKPLTVSLRQVPRHGTAILNPDNTFSYTPNPDTNGIQSFTYTVSASPHTAWATVFVTVNGVNDAPEFDPPEVSRSVVETASGGTKVGAPVTAEDADGDVLMYSLSGGGSLFEIESHTAQITVVAGALFDRIKEPEHVLTVTAFDRDTEATATVTVTVSDRAVAPISFGGGGFAGGGGGGGGGGPSPSVIDFEWSVKRDIEELDGGHGTPSGQWSDGATLWILENGDGADDAIYAYDLKTGERVEGREFELDEANRAPRGVWSDGSTAWVSDSGQEKLFAHDLGSGERLPERDIAFADRNRDARGIWSGDETMWVLDGGKESLFGYDFVSGESLAEYALDDANDDPRGLFFDGVTFWVSDHGEKRIFAYRLQAGEDGADELERNRDEEFPNTVLSRAGNNSPRGLWSDGEVMYVADESDARIYTYNMPDAIDARLSSLTLSGVDIGEFSPSHEEYEAVVADGVTETTVDAAAMQRRTDVDIHPPDIDEAAEGYQVALEDLGEITVTVTSADGSRERVYRVRLGEEEVAELAPEEAAEPAPEEAAGPVASCLRGDIAVGFSLIVYAGGGLEDLEACAEGRNVAALYTLDEGTFTSLILGAPDFVNQPFRGLFAGGVPSISPFIVRSEGPPTADPGSGRTPDDGAQWPDCLRGDIAAGFSLIVYEGGSAEQLEVCAQSLSVTALYALDDGEFVSLILGAPDFVNAPFSELFVDGVPPATPLIARSN